MAGRAGHNPGRRDDVTKAEKTDPAGEPVPRFDAPGLMLFGPGRPGSRVDGTIVESFALARPFTSGKIIVKCFCIVDGGVGGARLGTGVPFSGRGTAQCLVR